MANDNINIGIVGLGFMAAMHIRAYRKIDGVTVAAICDLDPSDSKATSPKYPAISTPTNRSNST